MPKMQHEHILYWQPVPVSALHAHVHNMSSRWIRDPSVLSAMLDVVPCVSPSVVSMKCMQDIDNRDLKMSKYAGKVLLVCNVASQCGFTPQV